MNVGDRVFWFEIGNWGQECEISIHEFSGTILSVIPGACPKLQVKPLDGTERIIQTHNAHKDYTSARIATRTDLQNRLSRIQRHYAQLLNQLQ